MAADPCSAERQKFLAIQKQLDTWARTPLLPGETHPDPYRVATVHHLMEQSYAAHAALINCEIAHGGEPSLSATLNGTGTLTITGKAGITNPIQGSISIGLVFEAPDRKTVDLASFNPIVARFGTPIGTDTATLIVDSAGDPTDEPRGSFDASTGSLVFQGVPITITNSISEAGTSNLSVDLSTSNPSGSNLNNGQIALAGSGNFQGGYLDGANATIVINGTLSPTP